MNKIFLYLKFSLKALLLQPTPTTLKGIFNYYQLWNAHLGNGKNSVTDRQPWMAFGAIDFLRNRITKSMKVFEYGSGGSTLFWAERAAKVISVEHHEGWYLQMQQELTNRSITNVEYNFIPGKHINNIDKNNFEDPEAYLSADESTADLNFKEYVQAIDAYPPEYFDIVIVDGRSRPSCIKHALPKITKGGFLVVDNSERSYYLRPFTFKSDKWRKWTFNGPVPYNFHFSQTTILQKIK